MNNLESQFRRAITFSQKDFLEFTFMRPHYINDWRYWLYSVLGLYAAAHALDFPWIIIKGISDYADCRKSGSDRWRSFASLMAASLTAHVLSDPVVFQDWPHYKETREYYNDLLVSGIFHSSLQLYPYTNT